MDFVPKAIAGNDNVSDTHPLKEFFVLAGGILGSLVLLYLILGLLVQAIIPFIPPKVEQRIGVLYEKSYAHAREADSPRTAYVQSILDKLQRNMEDPPFRYRVHLIESPEANAYALPGGHIEVCSGLLSVVESENELAMILAHELGHFVNRDHLKQLGRSLLFSTVSVIVFGEQSFITSWLQSMLGSVEAGFSKQQEALADRYGLLLLNKTYGHAAGAADFFQHIQNHKHDVRFLALFATHPYSEKRIKNIRAVVSERNMLEKERIPLPDHLLPRKPDPPE